MTSAVLISLAISFVISALVLRLATMIVLGSPATWSTAIVGAIAIGLIQVFVFPFAMVNIVSLFVGLGFAILAVPAAYVAYFLLLAIGISLVVRTRHDRTAPGLGAAVVIAIVNGLALSAVGYVADAIV